MACVQYQMRKVNSFAEFARQVTYFVDIAADYRSDFVLLPELFTVQLLSQVDALSPQEGMKKLAAYTPRFTKLMQDLAVKYGITIIAGSHPVFWVSGCSTSATSACPTAPSSSSPSCTSRPTNASGGASAAAAARGDSNAESAKIGVLICYDVEFPEAVRHLADEGAEILFVPFCTDNRQGYLRVRYCAQARAIENQIYVALAGNVGNLPDVANMDVQYGQAAVFTPSDFAFARDGIAAEADSNEETVLICDLDLDDSARLAQRRHGDAPTRPAAGPVSVSGQSWRQANLGAPCRRKRAPHDDSPVKIRV